MPRHSYNQYDINPKWCLKGLTTSTASEAKIPGTCLKIKLSELSSASQVQENFREWGKVSARIAPDAKSKKS